LLTLLLVHLILLLLVSKLLLLVCLNKVSVYVCLTWNNFDLELIYTMVAIVIGVFGPGGLACGGNATKHTTYEI
jgi:hypothetical protein